MKSGTRSADGTDTRDGDPRDPKRCACTGVRWCAACRDPEIRQAHGMRTPMPLPEFHSTRSFDARSQCAPGQEHFQGLRVLHDFISESEAVELLRGIESEGFVASQSGKWKQHYGPRINFLKRKMNASDFRGIPRYAHALEVRLRARTRDALLLRALASYRTTDVFVLRYHEREQSNLDLHTDDTYAYGELILDLSLESDSVMTFYQRDSAACVRVPLPARSLVALFGAARYAWEHAILSGDVRGRRTSITLRTLGRELRQTEAGRRVMLGALRGA